jgi:hypothetical protein
MHPAIDSSPSDSRRRQWSRLGGPVAASICAISMLAPGCWSYVAPRSFADFIDYAPYNRHLIHDVGAFQTGIGVTTLLALVWDDSLAVALAGFVVAGGLHTLSHALDRRIGGHAADVPVLGLFTIVAVFALAARIRRRRS